MVKSSIVKDSSKLNGKPWLYFLVGAVAIVAVGLFFMLMFFGLILSLAGSESVNDDNGNIALISIDGAIMGSGSDGYFDSGVASSQSLVKQIKSAEEDEFVEAIFLYINSPGGSAVASDEIANAVLLSEKPTIAVIREVGASGAYWVASASDHVIANRMSITGSIGVISSYLEFSEMMEEYGVSYQRLVAGEKKDIGSPFRTLASNEEELLQGKIDLIHDYFIDAVAENRGLSRMAVAEAASGEFYLGIEALELGLIDELGDLKSAENHLLSEYGIETDGYVNYQSEGSLIELLGSLSAMHGIAMGTSLGEKLVEAKTTATEGLIEVLI